MINGDGLNFSKVLADIGGISAAMFGVSFLYGYVHFKAFLTAAGIEWYAQNLSTTFYAVQAIDPFLLIGPTAVVIYLLMWPVSRSRDLIIWYYSCSCLIAAYFVYCIWLYSYGFEEGSVRAARTSENINVLMLGVLGAAISIYLCCLKVCYKSKGLIVMQIFFCLTCALLAIPRTSGYAKALIMRDTSASELPYVQIDQERWAILDYQRDNSLLIRYVSGSHPETKFMAIEKSVIRSDARVLYPHRFRPKQSN